MKNLVLPAFTVCCAIAAAPAQGDAVANGVASRDAEPRAPDARDARPVPRARARGTTLIDFDDRTQPSVFASAQALHSEYENLGATFLGWTRIDGGAVLDAKSFTVSGFSPPNILAFNSAATLSTGGRPTPPEEIWFRPTVTMVSCRVATAAPRGAVMTMVAYEPSGNVVARSQVSIGSQLQPVMVTGGCISRVLIDTSTSLLVIDDLEFTPGTCSDRSFVALNATTAEERVDLRIEAPARARGVALVSAGHGTGAVELGPLRLVGPAHASVVFTTSERGDARVGLPVPLALRGHLVAQAVAIDPATGRPMISNPSFF